MKLKLCHGLCVVKTECMEAELKANVQTHGRCMVMYLLRLRDRLEKLSF